MTNEKISEKVEVDQLLKHLISAIRQEGDERGVFFREITQGVNLDNEVLWTNQDDQGFELPSVGDRYRGPIFMKYGDGLEAGEVELLVNHNRCFSVKPTVLNAGNKYFSFKGVGVHRFGKLQELGVEIPGDKGNYFGLYDQESAEWDRDKSFKIKSFGCRVVTPVSIIKLKELPKTPNGILLRNSFVPVVYIRSFISDLRVEDISEDSLFKSDEILELKFKLEVEKVMADLSLEFGIKFTPKMYLKWFAKTLAKNLAIMHKNGYVHRYIAGGNLTLACEFVDMDSVCHVDEVEGSDRVEQSKINILNSRKNKNKLAVSQFLRDINGRRANNLKIDGAVDMISSLACSVVQLFPNEMRSSIVNDDDTESVLFENYFCSLLKLLDKIFTQEYKKHNPKHKKVFTNDLKNVPETEEDRILREWKYL